MLNRLVYLIPSFVILAKYCHFRKRLISNLICLSYKHKFALNQKNRFIMKTKFLTLVFFITLLTNINAQDIPSFTYQQYHFYPEGALDGSPGTTFDPANMCCLYQGNYNIGIINAAPMVISQGGGSAIVDLYIPPFVNGFSFSVDDPVLAAGNPSIRMALIGEYEIGSTPPSSYNEGDIPESEWKFVYSANRLFYNDRDPNFKTQASIARIAIYNGLNWGYTTLSDYPNDIPLSDIDITWFIAQEDSADYAAWANGTTTKIINTTYNDNNIIIYPNPVSNNLYITNVKSNETIQILDLTGKIIINKKIGPNNKIDLSFLQNGIYFIKTGSVTKKIIKK